MPSPAAPDVPPSQNNASKRKRKRKRKFRELLTSIKETNRAETTPRSPPPPPEATGAFSKLDKI